MIKSKYENGTFSGKTIDSVDNLLNFDMPKILEGNTGEHYFNKSDVHKAIEKIFDVNSTYIFLMTVANDEAVKKLSGKSVKRSYMFDSDEEFMKMHVNIDEKNEKVELSFEPDTMMSYLTTLKDMVLDKIGDKHYVSYSLVKTEGNTEGNTCYESIYWPNVHVIRDYPKQGFEDIVNKLNDDKAYQFAKKHELPKCYNMGEIKFLKEKNIPPLKVLQRNLIVSGPLLKDSIDFLSQFSLKYQSNSSSRGGDND